MMTYNLINLSHLVVCLTIFAMCRSTSATVPSGINLTNVTTSVLTEDSNLATLKGFLILKSCASVEVILSHIEMEEGSFIEYEGTSWEYEGKTFPQVIFNSTVVLTHKSFLQQTTNGSKLTSCPNVSSVLSSSISTEELPYNYTGPLWHIAQLFAHAVDNQSSIVGIRLLVSSTVNMNNSSMHTGNMALFNANVKLNDSTVKVEGRGQVSGVTMTNSTVNMKISSMHTGNGTFIVFRNTNVKLNDSTVNVEGESRVTMVSSTVDMKNSSMQFGNAANVFFYDTNVKLNDSTITVWNESGLWTIDSTLVSSYSNIFIETSADTEQLRLLRSKINLKFSTIKVRQSNASLFDSTLNMVESKLDWSSSDNKILDSVVNMNNSSVVTKGVGSLSVFQSQLSLENSTVEMLGQNSFKLLETTLIVTNVHFMIEDGASVDFDAGLITAGANNGSTLYIHVGKGSSFRVKGNCSLTGDVDIPQVTDHRTERYEWFNCTSQKLEGSRDALDILLRET